MLDPTIFSRYKTKQDFDREAEEFEFRKRQRQMQEQLGGLKLAQAQKSLAQPEQLEMEQLLAKSIQLGGVQNLSPSEQAQLQAFDIAQRTKQSVDPRGNIVTNRSIFDMLPREAMNMPIASGGFNPNAPMQITEGMGSPMQPPSLPAAGGNMYNTGSIQPIDMSQLSDDPALASQQAILQRQQQVGTNPMQRPDLRIDPSQYGVTSPYAREDVGKAQAQAQIGLITDIAKLDYQEQLRIADETLKSQEGKQKVGNIIARMQQINQALKEKDAIVSVQQGGLSRTKTTLETSPLGQVARKVTDPEAQALASEYEKLQATLLPFFAKASGLGAKSLDSEGERKSIMGSFGDPGGIYETNLNQLQNLEQLFGVQQGSNNDPLGLFE